MASLKQRVKQRNTYVQIGFRAEPEFKQRLQTLADKNDITLTDLLVIACEDVLKKYDDAPTKRR